MRLHLVRYVHIVKSVLNLDKHEEIELHGYGQGGMARLTQVVNILSNWGYIHVLKIKTRSDPGLKIVVKRTTDFQKNFDDFALKLQEKREERERLRAEKKAEEGTTRAEAETEATTTKIEAEADAEAAAAVKADAEVDAEVKADAPEAAKEGESAEGTAASEEK
mmetsp:Transcript_7360/g.10421  ORF Transcript_7360/g.10421 Transcript_7360/m.10421 type:complete len:164 (-) Transcript_7360:181-672(-)